jgi:hypothetical protein
MTRLTLSILLLAACSAAAAGDGALEINQDCVLAGCFAGDTPGFPVTISAGGRYRVVSDLDMAVANPAVHGIVVSAPDRSVVEIDLGGFTLNGRNQCSGYPVTDCVTFVNGGSTGIDAQSSNAVVHVRNGTVRGMREAGVIVSAASGSSIEDLTITECNTLNSMIGALIVIGDFSVSVTDVRVTRNRFGGMASVANATITRSVFSGNAGYGISVTGGEAIVRESTFNDNSGLGLTATALVALGDNAFLQNNGGSANTQFSASVLRNMGGNVCSSATCP